MSRNRYLRGRCFRQEATIQRERDTCVKSLDAIAELDTISRLHIYDYMMKQFREHLHVGNNKYDTEREISAVLDQVAIRFGVS